MPKKGHAGSSGRHPMRSHRGQGGVCDTAAWPTAALDADEEDADAPRAAAWAGGTPWLLMSLPKGEDGKSPLLLTPVGGHIVSAAWLDDVVFEAFAPGGAAGMPGGAGLLLLRRRRLLGGAGELGDDFKPGAFGWLVDCWPDCRAARTRHSSARTAPGANRLRIGSGSAVAKEFK